MAQIEDKDVLERRSRVVEWLVSKNYADEQQLYCSQRAPMTCTWFLECPEYNEWLDTKSRILFCTGGPGAGKTLLTSDVVSNLHGQRRPVGSDRPRVGIAYIYFRELTVQSSSADAVIQSQEGIFRNILGQLLSNLPATEDAMPFFAPSRKLYDAHLLQGSIRQPGFSDIMDAFRETAAWYDHVFVVLDALDECPVESRHFISSLIHTQAKLDVRIFATCRTDTAVPQLVLDTCTSRDVRASNADIERYLGARLLELSHVLSRNQHLEQQVIQEIAAKSNGSFLLARVYMDILATGTETVRVLKEKLSRFRSGGEGQSALFAAYDGIIDLINRHNSNQDGLAHRALAAVAFSPSALRTLQLRHALAISDEAERLEQEVKLDSVDHIINYLRSKNELLRKANGRMAASCISYLLFPDFSGGPVFDHRWKEKEVLDELVRDNLLLRYASSAWPSYLSRVNPEVISKLLRRLAEHPQNLELSFQVHTMARGRLFPKDLTITHIVSHMGSPDFIPVLKRAGCFDYRTKDRNGWTALHWAVCRQDGLAKDMAKTLLDFGCEVNAADKEARTPLSYVAEYGNPELARLLLKRRAKTETNRNSLSPLAQACACGHAEVTRVLLEHGAKVNAISGQHRQTPLGAAISGDSEECVAAILARRKLKKDHGTYEHGTALHQAAYYSSVGVVAKLVDAGFDVNNRTANKTTPLQAAVAGAHICTSSNERIQVVKFLLEQRAEVNAERGQFGTALDAALRNRNRDVEDLLREYGATRYTKEFEPPPTSSPASKDPFIWDAIGRYGSHFLAQVAVGNDKKIQQHIDMKVALFKTAIQNKNLTSIRFHTDFSAMAFQALVKQARKDMEREEDIRNGNAPAPRPERSRFKTALLASCVAPILNFLVWSRVRETERRRDDEAFHATSSATAKLDLIVSAAVRILSDAIEDGDATIVQMLSRSWVDALKGMFAEDFNDNMAQELVTNRAREFEGFFRQGAMDKANLMAKLALELMSAAIQGSKMDDRGKEREKLAIALSSIWSLTLRNVIKDNGGSPSAEEAAYQQLDDFLERIKKEITQEIKDGNWEYIRRIGPCCFETLVGLVADDNARAAAMVARILVEGWQVAIDEKMDGIDIIIKDLEQEFKVAIRDLAEDSNVRLEMTRPWVMAGALFKILHAAVRYNCAPIKRKISHLLLSNISVLQSSTSPEFMARVRTYTVDIVPVWCEVDENPVYLLESGVAMLSAMHETGYFATYSEEGARRAIASSLCEPSDGLTKLEARVRQVLANPASRDDAGRIKETIKQLQKHLGAHGDKILPGLRNAREAAKKLGVEAGTFEEFVMWEKRVFDEVYCNVQGAGNDL
ncbi:hypothetical protein F5144DRAFT_628016 [Chaetomium tenue]|uniref:Uncharacterized protein n=1 Tax=Chaetomium tenue TaxID=1854479 RepID=A0ACB7PEV8_9PEZI|nr:hypothetical protein F5144DRAFT_628016 [Chaetomium globosum]